jgi:16S rRNA G966 N2-methylase RsmD
MPDRVRESVFSILRGHTEDAAVFDGFAGTGSIGLEAVSRGASRCVLVEKDRRVADLLRRNIETLGVQDRCELVVGDALGAGALARCPSPAHLVFFDPPYALIDDPTGWRRVKAQFEALVRKLDDTGFAVLRTRWPFFHWADASGNLVATPRQPEPEPAPDPRGKRARREPARRPRAEWDPERAEEEFNAQFDALMDDDDEEPDAGAEPESVENPGPGEGFTRVEADLCMAGAQGPETHVYHHTAVHLYMKGQARVRRPDA